MAELDLSAHLLNNSTSKQKFSFPKTERFRMQQKILYPIPHIDVIATTKSQALVPAGLPLSDLDIKILDWRMISSLHPLARMISAPNSRKIRPKGSASVAAEM